MHALAALALLAIVGAASSGVEAQVQVNENPATLLGAFDSDDDGRGEAVGTFGTGTYIHVVDNEWALLYAANATGMTLVDEDGDGLLDLMLTFDNGGIWVEYAIESAVSLLLAPLLFESTSRVRWLWSDTGAPRYVVQSSVVSGTGSSWGAVLTREEAGCDGAQCGGYFAIGPTYPADGNIRNLRVWNANRQGRTFNVSNTLVR